MNNYVLSEKELENVFYHKSKKSKVGKALLGIVFFVLAVTAIYVAINYNSLSSNLNYWFKNDYAANPESEKAEIIIPKDTKKEPTLPEITDNTLLIPQIGVEAPISWNINNTPTEVSANLEKGVIHLSGTALPGQNGNVFITGHSSNYPWARGDYNHIFALLNKIVSGDMVQLKYRNNNFVYKVSEIKVVKPDDISVLSQTSSPVLTLMTCTPVGTSLNRLIIVAKQVHPSTTETKEENKNNSTPSSLPRIR